MEVCADMIQVNPQIGMDGKLLDFCETTCVVVAGKNEVLRAAHPETIQDANRLPQQKPRFARNNNLFNCKWI